MTPLNAGDLTHRIEIRRSAEVRDGRGSFETVWTTIARPWAEKISLDGKEAIAEHVLEGASYYRFRIRWRRGIEGQTKLQVRSGGLDLNITSAVDPDGKREQIVILATTKSAMKAG